MGRRRASTLRAPLAIAVTLFAALVASPPISHAAAARGRVLRGLDSRAVPGATELTIHFGVPIRYLRHTPERSGTSIDVELTLLAQGAGDSLAALGRESLGAPPGSQVPLVDVTYVGDRTAGPVLEIRFSRSVDFEIRQGRDLRSLVVTLPDAVAPPRPPPPPPTAAAVSGPDAAEIAALVTVGRDALAGGNPARAVPLFTRVLDFPEHERSAEARELLGNAREEAGQLAQARAEYETYLERYPDGVGAPRVRQRLEAIVAGAAGAPPPTGGPAPRAWGIVDHDVVGSLSTHYRYDVHDVDSAGRLITDDSLYTDLYLSGRLTTERFDLGGEVTGSYLANFVEGRSDRSRVNTLFVEVVDRGSPLFGTVGRQPGNTAGVTSRFDGGTLGFRLNDTFTITARGGFPADPYIDDHVETDAWFYGLSVDAKDLAPGLDAQLYVLQQEADGWTDRTAVGGEFSYVRGSLFLSGMLDYDLHFDEVSIGILTANWRATEATSLNLILDYRLSPLLTTRNALLGQPETDLDDLERRLPGVDLDDLAEDRTARSRFLSLDVTHRLSDRFQLVGDFMVSDLDGTPSSGGVLGFEGTGYYYTYLVQLIGNRLITNGDVARVVLRYDDGKSLDRTSLLIATRIPVGSRLRLNPLFTFQYGEPAQADPYYLYRPGVRLDYRIGPITLDAQFDYEWVKGERFAGTGDEDGYTILVGARYDF